MFFRASNIISSRNSFLGIREKKVGGKAWNLFRLVRRGFGVPPFFVVSTAVFEESIRRYEMELKDLLRGVGPGSKEEIEFLSVRLRELVMKAAFPPDFCRSLAETLNQMFGPDVRLAVRSSVAGEDSARHSFAGQMDSFLNVLPADIPDAVKKVWASGFSSRALAYRRERQIGLEKIAVAVIVQEMVPAESSGILFTRDPDDRGRECVISAGFGLGEGVVSNRVETDTYRISWQGDSVFRSVAVKDFQVQRMSRGQGGTRLESVGEEKQRMAVLTDDQVRSLRNIGIAAERRLGTPLDLEWALDAEGRLFILQARPIVFRQPVRTLETLRIWDNSNIVESYPGLTLPLTFSFVRRCYETIMRDAALNLTWVKKPLRKKEDIYRSMIGLIDGRVYYNLRNWYRLQAHFPGFRKYKDSWDRMIGISRPVPFPSPRLSLLHRLSASLIVLRILLSVKRTARRFSGIFGQAYRRFSRFDVAAASEHELLAFYSEIDGTLGHQWYLTLYNDLCAIKYYDWLRELCSHWGPGDRPSLANDLLCGDKGVESVAPVRSLIRLAERFRLNPTFLRLLDEKDDRKVWKAIQSDPDLTSLKEAFNAHLQAYGDRGLEELKLETPTFRENPAQVIRLVRSYVRQDLSIDPMEEKERARRWDAEAVARVALKNPLRRLVFRFVLRNTRLSIANRENMRFARTRLFGLVRRIFRRLGMLLQEKGVLARASDINYLTIEEVFMLIQGTAVTQDVRPLIAVRAAEYRRHAEKKPRERFETTGIPYLDSQLEAKEKPSIVRKLRGTPCSSGPACGPAKVVLDPGRVNGDKGHILVARSTDPGWVFLMISAKGIVTERGSILSHTAIIGRELGIPTIVGVKNATRLIPDGARLQIDGGTGEIQWQ